MDPWLIAGITLAGGVAMWIVSRKRPLTPEVSVRSLLTQLGGNYVVLSGSILQSEKGMIRIENSVVSPYGVFILNECREVGQVDVQPGKREWQISGMGKNHLIYNPLWQTKKVIQELENRVGDFPFIPLVVFTRARLTGARDYNVVEGGNMIAAIKSYTDPILTEDHQKKIMGILG